MAKPLTIGHLARATGVNVETVRYYQRFGIITEPPKPVVGYRVYPTDTVDRILFIRRAKELGFSLQEIAELLRLGDGHCEDVRLRAEEKRADIDRQISDLRSLRKTLNVLIQACKADNDTAHCPIVETLAKRQ
jgi:MerR family transcriptional regulator, mercuric resistance operon regulatory protein